MAKRKTIEQLKEALAIADVEVEEANEWRNSAVEGVVQSCIHSLSGSVSELQEADTIFQEAICTWGRITDDIAKLEAGEAKSKLHVVA